MTSQDLLLQLCMHETQINQHAGSLVRVMQFFNGRELWPDQCEFAINVFSSVLKPIRSLNELLAASGVSSKEIHVNRYSLLAESHQLERGIVRILSRLEMYRKSGGSSLKQEHPEYQEMLSDLESLLKNYNCLSEAVGRIIANAPSPITYIS